MTPTPYHFSSARRGFTLIELLVVIAIIAILMGLLFPVINKILRDAKRSEARADAETIAAAINMFWNDYQRLPVPSSEQGLSDDGDDATYLTEARSRDIILTLLGDNINLNPREKVYLDTNTIVTDGTFLDPWGSQYLIKLDRNYNMKIEYVLTTGLHGKRSVVISPGPDRDATTTDDNVANVDLPN